MGVMLPDVVKAIFPEEHAPAEHVISIEPQPVVGPSKPVGWSCSCGHQDVLMPEELQRALRENLVALT